MKLTKQLLRDAADNLKADVGDHGYWCMCTVVEEAGGPAARGAFQEELKAQQVGTNGLLNNPWFEVDESTKQELRFDFLNLLAEAA